MSFLPQPELSVAGGIGVPVGEGGEPPLEEGTLEHEGREGWLRHGGSRWRLMVRCGLQIPLGSRRLVVVVVVDWNMARAKESFRMDLDLAEYW